MEKTLRLGHSNWVVGDEFWDREEDLALFTDKLNEGANLLLIAQRRMGKTSLMKEASRRLADSYRCLYVDFEKATSPEDAVVEMSLITRPYEKLWARTKGLFRNALSRLAEGVEEVSVGELGITLRSGLTSGTWKKRADDLFAILADADRPVIVMMDEVPILVNTILRGGTDDIVPGQVQIAAEFLLWLRGVCTRHRGRVRVVVSGSIGLEPVLRRVDLSATINLLEPFDLKPWTDEAAAGCLEALGRGYGIEYEAGTVQGMLHRLGCNIPHHVQMYFTKLHDFCRRRGSTRVSDTDAEEIFNTEMLSIHGHAELAHYEERLRTVFGRQLAAFALELLTEASVEGILTVKAVTAQRENHDTTNVISRKEQNHVLQTFEHDGYLQRSDGGYIFVSGLLKEWWKARNGFGYIPLTRRIEQRG